MKRSDRIKKLEENQPNTNPAKLLSEIGERWLEAVFSDNEADAKAARSEAQPLLDEYPEMIKPDLMEFSKVLYLEWKEFLAYPRKAEIKQLYGKWQQAMKERDTDRVYQIANKIKSIYQEAAGNDAKLNARIPRWLSKDWSHEWHWLKICTDPNSRQPKDEFIESYEASTSTPITKT